jgi:hypothetical protein
LKLHLGVVDVSEPAGGTTGSVATQLEENYGLFSAFYETKKDQITHLIEEDVDIAIEALINGSALKNPFGDSTSTIDILFKDFLSTQEAERVLAPGKNGLPVPTKAALEGKSLRLKGGKKIRKVKKGQEYQNYYGNRRPSFIDSGVFEASFKAWVE